MTAVKTKFASMFGERVCHSFVMSLVYGKLNAILIWFDDLGLNLIIKN